MNKKHIAVFPPKLRIFRRLKLDPSVTKWFSGIFYTFILSFVLVLLPLYFYLNNMFVSTETERAQIQLKAGVAQLDSSVKAQFSMLQILNTDSRFFPLYYTEPDYNAIDLNTQKQLRTLFSSMVDTQAIVDHAAIIFDDQIIITSDRIFYRSTIPYYTNFFEADGLSYEKWLTQLRANTNRFSYAYITLDRVSGTPRTYRTLVFCTPGRNQQLTYFCIDIDELKQTIASTSTPSEYAITFTTTRGELIYTDRPDDFRSHHTLTASTAMGNLTLTVEISDRLFSERMASFYTFIIIYTLAALALLALLVWAGTHLSARPVIKILHAFESSRHLPAPKESAAPKSRLERTLFSDFDRIASSIAAADSDLGQYQQLSEQQQKILRLRFFEKAVADTLVTQADREALDLFFPDFPSEYYLALLRVTERETNELPQIMALLQSFAQERLSNCYAQQFSAHELVLLIPRTEFEASRAVLDFVIENVNAQEPAVQVAGYASSLCSARGELPHAYRQLLDMELCFFEHSSSRLCTPDARSARDVGAPFYMADLQTMYTAINSGNNAMAQLKLRACSDSLAQTQNAAWMRSGCALFRSILNYIRLEHGTLLMDFALPEPNDGKNLFELFSPVVAEFCAAISTVLPEKKNELADEILEYINENFTNDQLSLTWLEGALKYSTSTMQKAVKSATGMTIAAYIEKKRMAYANELIAEKKRTIADIAAACGFGSVNSFYKAYKRVFGHAPTDGQS